MQVVQKYPANTFSWVDLATSDAAAAKDFYTRLFGWQANDMPSGPDMVYTMLMMDDKSVAGLFQASGEPGAPPPPPGWVSYVTVDDIVATAEQVSALGGNVVVPPMDVMEAGQMAMVSDPLGAMFALWQPKEHIGAQLVNIPNTFSWNELATTDPAKASAFYTALFGWETQSSEMPNNMVYTSFMNQGRAAGGMLTMDSSWGDMPPHWSVYFAVEDCDTVVARAAGLGAKIVVPATDIPNTGRFAGLQDPQGAFFYIIAMPYMDPPPGYKKA